jgi:hypothetical protein
MSRLTIIHGKICSGGLYDREKGHETIVPALTYQLLGADGKAITTNYSGPGSVVSRGEDSFAIVGNVNSPTSFLTEYKLSDRPTKESLDFRAGYVKGYEAKRKVYPKNVSRDYMDGYVEAWQTKRPIGF